MDFYCNLKHNAEVKECYHGHGYIALHIGQPIGWVFTYLNLLTILLLSTNFRQRIVVRKCGFGGFSTAWLCYNVQRKKFTVLKILRADCTVESINAELRVGFSIVNYIQQFL